MASRGTVFIRCGHVLRDDASALERADVLVENGRITAIAANLTRPDGAETLDASDCLVIPGLVNAHTHGVDTLFRGLSDRWTLEDLLNHGPALSLGHTTEDQYVSTAIAAIEMLKTGCTAAYDLFAAAPIPTIETAEAVVRAYMDVGLRAVVAPAVADLPFYQTVPGLIEQFPPALRKRVERMPVAPAHELARLAERVIGRFHGAAGGRIRVNLAPTIPTQCSDEFLSLCARQSREFAVGVHTHLAESKIQAIAAVRRWGRTATAQLDDLGLIGPGFVGAHGVWLTDDDIGRLAGAGAVVAHNPASNLRLGSGLAPVREILDRGVVVALGSDGSMSSDNQNLFEAMRLAGLAGNVRFPYRPSRWPSAREVWRMATAGGARALGWGDELGALVPGYRADLVLLRRDSDFLRPFVDPIGSLVYVETGVAVDTVLVDGRVVVRSGQVVAVNEGRLREQAQAAADRLRGANSEAWRLAAEIAPHLSRTCHALAMAPFPVDRYAPPPKETGAS
jgi:guanine deaminase